MSTFYLPSTTASATSTPAFSSRDDSSGSDDDLDTLPYPTALPRSDFLKPDFDPSTYLSTLFHNRHQTLEDLRSDLRQRSQLLQRELLDLVNGEYEDFLSLGTDLKGGEEKVEGVRVGLLGLQREVEGVRENVAERGSEMGGLLREKRELRRSIGVGRALLEAEADMTDLEGSMGILEVEVEEDDEDEDEVEEDGDFPLRKLQRHTRQYILISRQVQRIGPDHPFLQARQPRLDELRKALLLDLRATLRRAKSAQVADATLTIVSLYGDLGAESEAVKVLKGG